MLNFLISYFFLPHLWFIELAKHCHSMSDFCRMLQLFAHWTNGIWVITLSCSRAVTATPSLFEMKVYLCILDFLFIPLLLCVNSEKLGDEIDHIENIGFKKTAKEWILYVKTILFQYLVKNIEILHHSKESLGGSVFLSIVKHISNFIAYSQSIHTSLLPRLTVDASRKCPSGEERKIAMDLTTPEEQGDRWLPITENKTRPIGSLKATEKSKQCRAFCEQQTNFDGTKYHLIVFYHISLSYDFNMDPSLSLNVSLHHVKFMLTTGLHKCFVGHLNIFDGRTKVSQYCGLHSFLRHHLGSSYVSVVLEITSCVEFTVLMSFSVTDVNQVFSVYTGSNLPSQNLNRWVWRLSSVGKFVMKYSVSVEKYQTTVIVATNLTTHRLAVYNGPGSQSPKSIHSLNQSFGTVFQASSFQCVLFVWFPTGLFFFSGVSILNTTLNLNTTTSIIFPSSECKRNSVLCAFQIKTTPETYPAVQPNNFVFHTQADNTFCQFAGIASFTLRKADEINSLSSCVNSDDFSRSRPFYSTTSQMLLVLYTHKEYGKLYLNLTTFTVSCSPIILNICEMTKQTYGAIQFHPIKSSWGGGDVTVNTENNNCTILQLFHSMEKSDPQEVIRMCPKNLVCAVYIRHSKLLTHSVQYEVQGHYPGKFVSLSDVFVEVASHKLFTNLCATLLPYLFRSTCKSCQVE